MKSIVNNNISYRILVLIFGIVFLLGLNYFVFGYFMGVNYSIYLVVLWLFCGIVLWYLIKFFKYIYEIKDNHLFVYTPKRIYKIPFTDIKNVGKIDKIELNKKIGTKFDTINKILYLSGFANKGIIIKLPTHDIVIAPRKEKEFYDYILENI